MLSDSRVFDACENRKSKAPKKSRIKKKLKRWEKKKTISHRLPAVQTEKRLVGYKSLKLEDKYYDYEDK